MQRRPGEHALLEILGHIREGLLDYPNKRSRAVDSGPGTRVLATLEQGGTSQPYCLARLLENKQAVEKPKTGAQDQESLWQNEEEGPGSLRPW